MHAIYLSGPMTGIEDFNRPAFNAEAARLRALGYTVVNPAEIKPVTTYPATEWERFIRADIRELMLCDTLALLPNWYNSKGARLEFNTAVSAGIAVVDASAITELFSWGSADR